MTAANIARLVSKFKQSAEKQEAQSNPPDPTSIISKGYQDAVMAMIEQIRLAKSDRWQSTSKEAAIFWLKVMENKIMQQPFSKKRKTT